MKSRRTKLPTDRVIIGAGDDFSMEFTALCHPMPQHLRRGRNTVTGKVIAYPDDPSGRYRHMIQLLEMRAKEAAGGRTVLGPVALEVVWIFHCEQEKYLKLWCEHRGADLAEGVPCPVPDLLPHQETPDTDNLIKPLKDSITRSRLWGDDKQISHENVMKRWSATLPNQIRVYITRDRVEASA